ncbi:MAG: DNA internalization-related competence protein ComEC/Rec2 [Rhodothermaceae bacterium]
MLLGKYLSPDLIISVIVLTLSLITAILFRKKSVKAVSVAVILISCFAGVIWFQMQNTEKPHYPFEKQNLKNAEVFGKIADVELTGYDKFSFILFADSVKIKNKTILISDKIKVIVKDKNFSKLDSLYRKISIGDKLNAICNLRKARDKRNPGEFDFYEYLRENGITILGYVKSSKQVKITKNPNFISNIVFDVRKNIDAKLKDLNNRKTYSLLRGLILADRSLIDYNDKKNFVNSGVIHVLAVSGLHVGYIALIFMALFSRFHILLRNILIICGLLSFMIITGVPASVFRATLMGIILILSNLSGRGNFVFNTLALSGFLILLIKPADIFDPGFQLSFSAVLSIITFAPFFTEKIKKLKLPKFLSAVLTLFSVSLAAQIGTLPFTLFYFGKLSLIALLANLIVIPLIGIIIGIAVTGLTLSYISSEIAIFYSVTNNLLTGFLFQLTKFSGGLKYSFITITNFSIWDSLLFYFVIGVISFVVNRFRHKKAIFAAVVFAILIYLNLDEIDNENLFPENIFTVCAIDVGQGDAFLLKFPNGKTAIIDAGNATPYFDNGTRVILPLLNHLGIEKIDYAFITHLDSDHYKGILSLVKENKVELVYKPPLDSTLKKDLRFEKFLNDNSVKFKYYKKEILDIGNCRLYFLADTKSPFYADFDVNNKSGIIKLIHGNNTFLFVGDAEHEMESWLAAGYKNFLKSDYLKVSHHGSKTGTIPEFIRFVKPEIAVISAGIENKFKHPSPSVVQRLKQYNCAVDRTDKEGAVIYQSDGTKIKKIYWR